MSTVAQAINRLYREYLYPASDQPTRALLAEELDNSETGVDLTVTILTPEEIDLFGEGVVIEIDQELMLVTAYAAGVATVIRGWQGTTAATHTTNTPVYLAPQFHRLHVFNAICDAVVDLYPELYAVVRTAVTSQDTPLQIDDADVEVQSFRWEDDDGVLFSGEVEFVDDYTTTANANKFVQFLGVPEGQAGFLTTFRKFTRPTAESDDLAGSTWNIPEEWVKILMADALATLVASRQADRLNTDFIVELLVREGFTTQDSRQVVTGLIALRNEWVNRAQKRQRQSTAVRIEMME